MGIGLAVFVTVYATSVRLSRLPLRSLIKEELGLSPAEMAEFFAIAGLAWYLKPIAGMLSDQVRLFGSHRRHYLLLASVGGAAIWILTSFVWTSIHVLLACMIAINVMAALGNTVVGGLLVEHGRLYQAISRLSAVRVGAMVCASLVAGPLGGWLAGRAFSWTCSIGASLMVLMGISSLWLLPRDITETDEGPLRERLRQIAEGLRERAIWRVALFAVCVYVAPGFQSLLYYHQRDVIGIGDQSIGLLASLNCVGGICGALTYGAFARRIPLKSALILGILLCCSCATLYLFYSTWTRALAFEPVFGFCFTLGLMPIHELSARASPSEHAAFGFALILGVCNAAIALSDVMGTMVARSFGADLNTMIVVNIGGMLASLLLLRVIPAEVLAADRHVAEDARAV